MSKSKNSKQNLTLKESSIIFLLIIVNSSRYFAKDASYRNAYEKSPLRNKDKSSNNKSLSKNNESHSLGVSFSSIRDKSFERRNKFLPKEKQTKFKTIKSPYNQVNEAIHKCLNDMGIRLEKKIDFRKDTIDEFKDG